ncbi:MAG: C25 family cysteine peptidase [Planctomycetota bacterium]|nr:C25 family cysteine peptidase [Planctomycetota bacterium]
MKALAVKSGYSPSNIASATFAQDNSEPKLVIVVASGPQGVDDGKIVTVFYDIKVDPATNGSGARNIANYGINANFSGTITNSANGTGTITNSTAGTGTITSTGTNVTGTGTSFVAEVVVGDVIWVGAQSATVATIGDDLTLTTSTAFDPEITTAATFTIAPRVTVTVTGTGTKFLSEVAVGDVISVGAQTATVATVTSDTTLTTSAAFNPALSGATFTIARRTVTGTGTKFLSEVAVGDVIAVAAQTATVATVASDTLLTTANPFDPAITNATFTVSPVPVGIASALPMSADGKYLSLTTTTKLNPARSYTLTINNVKNFIGLKTIAPNTQGTFRYLPAGDNVAIGGASRDYYASINGGNVSDLTGNAAYPNSPTTSDLRIKFQAPSNFAEAYGQRMRAYFYPTTSGKYVFWIASDDSSELWFSPDPNSEEASTKQKVCWVNGATGELAWTSQGSQKSVQFDLVAGHRYYLEALQKEGGGGDNLAVGWSPDQATPPIAATGPIPGTQLSPYLGNPATGGAPTTNPPGVKEVIASGKNGLGQSGVNVTVYFDMNMDPVTAAQFARYKIWDNAGAPIAVSACSALSSDKKYVVLTTAQLVTGKTYLLSVDSDPSTGVRSAGGTPVAAEKSKRTFQYYAMGSVFEQYYDMSQTGGGGGMGNFKGIAAFPNSPKSTAFVTLRFEVPDNAGSDWQDNYGQRIRGYFYPPTGGQYTFAIASDDNSELWLSTDENPANAVRVAYVGGWTDPRKYQNNTGQQQYTTGTTKGDPAVTTALPNLVSGQRYYIEALQTEGGGGDNVSVAAVLGTVVNAGDNPGPIVCANLSPYVDSAVYVADPSNGPVLLGVYASGNNNQVITVVYDRQMGTSALTGTNYTIMPGTITGTGTLVFSSDMKSVVVPLTSTLSPGTQYTLTVLNATDAFGTSISPTLSGQVAKTNLSAVLVGTGTKFVSELRVGDNIRVPSGTGEDRVVVSIADNGHLTVNSAFGSSASGLTAQKIAVGQFQYFSTGSISLEWWAENLGGTAVSNLTGAAAFPNSPSGGSLPTVMDLGTPVTGTGTISSAGVTVTGNGSAFDTQVSVNNVIIDGTSNQVRTVVAINGNTELITATPFNPALGAGTAYRIGTSPKTGDNYGDRFRGYFIPPATGSYFLWIASDDQSELWFSTDDNPANKRLVSRVYGCTGDGNWTTESNQRSTAGTGKISVNATTAVTGSGTLFTTELLAGDQIFAGNQAQTVAGITDNTHLTTVIAFSITNGSLGFSTAKPAAGITGTVSTTGTTTVTGDSTSFLAQVAVGNLIMAAGQTQTVTAIGSDLSLTTAAAFNPVLGAGSSFSILQSLNLVGGQRYYIETLKKEGGGGDSTTVAWTKGGVPAAGVASAIPGAQLAPYIEPLRILTQPANQVVAPGANVTFSVVVSGSAPRTYQWYKNGISLDLGSDTVTGTKTGSLLIGNAGTSDSGSYSVVIGNPSGSVTSLSAKLTLTPTVQFSSSAAAADDGDSGATTYYIAVSADVAPTITGTVDYAVTGGTAMYGGVDYMTVTPSTLYFTPGTQVRYIPVTIIGDTRYNDDKTIVLTLSNPVNARLGANTTFTYTIQHADPKPTIEFVTAWSSAPVTVTSVSIPVRLYPASGKPAKVNYLVSGAVNPFYPGGGDKAADSSDYQLLNGTLLFQPGETQKTINMTVIDDETPDRPETIKITLVNDVGIPSPVDAVLGATGDYYYTIESPKQWDQAVIGDWITNTCWLPAGAPASANTTGLIFPDKGVALYTATQNIANPFNLNRMVLKGTYANVITGNQIQFLNPTPTPTAGISQTGTGAVTISTPISLGGATELGGDGTGLVTIGGVISGTNPAYTLSKKGNSTYKLGTGVTTTYTYQGVTSVVGGTTLGASTLIVDGTLDAQTNGVSVGYGAVLRGIGTINRNVSVGGTVAPGNTTGATGTKGTLIISTGNFGPAGGVLKIRASNTLGDKTVRADQLKSVLPLTLGGTSELQLELDVQSDPSPSVQEATILYLDPALAPDIPWVDDDPLPAGAQMGQDSDSWYWASNANCDVTTSFFTDTGATNGTTYYYVVTAWNSHGEGGTSTPAASAQATGGGSVAPNFGFEKPWLGQGVFKYGYQQPLGAWTFTNNAGIINNYSPWGGGLQAPEGGQVCMLQGSGSPGSITQNITLEANVEYKVSFKTALRDAAWSQSVKVTLGPVPGNLGTYTPAGTAFQEIQTTSSFTPTTAGSYVLTFEATDATNDRTAFVDDIRLNATRSLLGADKPEAPTGVTAVGGDNQVYLTWTPVTGANEATKYIVKRATSLSGPYTALTRVYSGSKANVSANRSGMHQHFFTNVSSPRAIATGDILVCYVRMDAINPPTEVMLQFHVGGNDWEHRGYWGANNLTNGTDGTDSRRYIGPLPQAGQWVRLEVPASQVGIVGRTLDGMAFTLCDGGAWFDYAATGGAATMTGDFTTKRITGVGVNNPNKKLDGSSGYSLKYYSAGVLVADTRTGREPPDVPPTSVGTTPWNELRLVVGPNQVTPITVDSFAARGEGTGVLVEWNTVSEYRNVGFNVWRREVGQTDKAWVKVNPSLIAGRITTPAPKTYRLYDTPAPGTYEYRLESISTANNREFYKELARPMTVEAGGQAEVTPEGAVAANESARAVAEQQRYEELGKLFAPPSVTHDVQSRTRTTAGGTPAVRRPAATIQPIQATGPRPAPRAVLDTIKALPVGVGARAVRAGSRTASVSAAKVVYGGSGVLLVPLASMPAGYNIANVAIEREGRSVQALALVPAGLLLYAPGYEDAYTDKDVFFLKATTTGTPAGAVTSATGLFNENVTALTSTASTVTAQFHDIYFDWALRPYTMPPWFSKKYLTDGSSQTFTVNLPDALPGAGQVTVKLWSFTDHAEASPDHALQVVVNGKAISDGDTGVTWDGGGKALALTFPVDAGRFASGDNTIVLRTPRVSSGVDQLAMVHSIVVDYTKAVRGQTTVQASGATAQVYEVSGVAAGLWIVNVSSDPDAATLVPYQVQGDRARFSVPGAGKYLVVPAGSELRAASVTACSIRPVPAGLAYLAVGPSQFGAAIAPLITARGNEGLTAAFVDQEEVFNYYGFGRYGPAAIRAAVGSVTPRFLLLVGRSTYDYRNYAGLNIATLCPTILAGTSFWSDAPADALFGDLGSGCPKISVGRMPVNTPEELTVAVQRTLSYQGLPATGWRALVTADIKDPAAGDFAAEGDLLADSVPEISWSKAYLGVTHANPPLVTEAMRQAASGDADLIVYIGHGNSRILGTCSPPILDANSVQTWTGNVVLLQDTCTANWFLRNEPDFHSIAIQALTQPQGGIAASIATTTYMLSMPDTEMITEIIKQAGTPGARWGEALLAAQQWAYKASGGEPGWYMDLGPAARRRPRRRGHQERRADRRHAYRQAGRQRPLRRDRPRLRLDSRHTGGPPAESGHEERERQRQCRRSGVAVHAGQERTSQGERRHLPRRHEGQERRAYLHGPGEGELRWSMGG